MEVKQGEARRILVAAVMGNRIMVRGYRGHTRDLCLAVALLLFHGTPCGAQTDSTMRSSARDARTLPRFGQDLETNLAIQNGLEFLKSNQLPSGAIGSRYTVAVTSLSGLAILGAGYRYRFGRFQSTLENILQFLKNVQSQNGYLADSQSRMHGHSYAILFLTQLYGELPGEEQVEVGRMIRNGLRLIEDSQSREGGWYYTPENPKGLDEASITICALQALRAANGIGFAVPKRVIDGAIGYVKKCQNEAGSFKYSVTLPDRHPSFALTVAAISTLHAAGIYDSPEIRKGLEYARRSLKNYPRNPMGVAKDEFFFYANFYAAQAFYQSGGDLWHSWYFPARQYLLKRQGGDGSWNDNYGVEFGTAMAVLILEIPLNYLPIFQR